MGRTDWQRSAKFYDKIRQALSLIVRYQAARFPSPNCT
jgi:hypothetical protein